jgi:hypothetical protein
VADFAPDAVMSFFEQTQRAKERRARLWGGVAPRRVNKPMPEPEVRSEPDEEVCPEPVEENEAPWHQHRPTVAFIVAHVARYYGVTPDDIASGRRDKSVLWPRHVAAYFGKELTLNSWAEIGRRIGDRDHTTILNSYSRIHDALNVVPQLGSDLCEIRKRIESCRAPAECIPMFGRPFWTFAYIRAPSRPCAAGRVRFYDRNYWTQERVQALREMWGAGATHREIAAALGTVTGAVSGKINRLGIVRNKRGERH